mgnify:CR=1 FL=1
MKDKMCCYEKIGLIVTISLNVLTSIISTFLIIIFWCKNVINLKYMYALGILLLVLESFNIINLLLYYFIVKKLKVNNKSELTIQCEELNKKLLEKLIDKK